MISPYLDLVVTFLQVVSNSPRLFVPRCQSYVFVVVSFEQNESRKEQLTESEVFHCGCILMVFMSSFVYRRPVRSWWARFTRCKRSMKIYFRNDRGLVHVAKAGLVSRRGGGETRDIFLHIHGACSEECFSTKFFTCLLSFWFFFSCFVFYIFIYSTS